IKPAWLEGDQRDWDCRLPRHIDVHRHVDTLKPGHGLGKGYPAIRARLAFLDNGNVEFTIAITSRQVAAQARGDVQPDFSGLPGVIAECPGPGRIDNSFGYADADGRSARRVAHGGFRFLREGEQPSSISQKPRASGSRFKRAQ